MLKDSFWVDDLVGGFDDLETALKISTESVEVMKRAGMVLRKWQTNSGPFRERYKQSGIETDDTKGCGVPCKVLGLAWDPDKDLIFFDVGKLKDIAANGGSTKRFVLHVLGSIFDTIGFLGAFIMKLKILIQELWAAKIDWNSELPPLLDYKWQLWCSEFEHLKEIFIPRHFLSGANEIQTLTEKAQWSHCPGKENPADILSRSISDSGLAQNSLWWHGPPWLSQPSEFWPSKVENEKPIGDLEIRNEVEIISQCKCAVYDSEFVLDFN
ncbi:hypothetical protein HNY73_012769 [Argiope bruennichi]|uniref:Uncharacterized protein n=1 Tax=Argiope bruennichi TaxID=94029 RepID=A0A8T0EXM6_ARGBR|nr:hypothetical protein HNY73_012769 [Argiope bruennichi]